MVESQGFKQTKFPFITVEPGPEIYVTVTFGAPKPTQEFKRPEVTMLFTVIACEKEV